jgi:hypothetical protein
MSGTIGTGTSTFAGLTMKFYSPAGKTLYNVDAGTADCTPDDAATKEWAPGDKPDWGTCDLEVLVQATLLDEIDTLIAAKTKATLANTLPIEVSGNTAGTVSGEAFIASHSLVLGENGSMTGPMSFRWTSKPTITEETP